MKINKKIKLLLLIIPVFIYSIVGINAYYTDEKTSTKRFNLATPQIQLTLSQEKLSATSAKVTLAVEQINTTPRIFKYAKGAISDSSYFTNSGTNITGNNFTVTENDTYTVYVSDSNTTYAMQQIVVDTRDTVDEATAKVGTVTVGNSNIELTPNETTSITLENCENIASYQSSAPAIVSVDNSGNVQVSSTAVAGNTATITITGTSGRTRTIVIEIRNLTGDDIVPATNYGQKVNYSVTVNAGTANEEILNDWKVFLKDGDYVYMIYGDYLPNTAIPATAKTTATGTLSTDGTYRVWREMVDSNAQYRQELIDAMATTSNWTSLITTNLQTAATNAGKTVTATGGPTAGQFKQSWNDQYTLSEGQVTITGNDTDGWTEQDLSGTTGYGVVENDNLYFPHKSALSEGASSCYGYWLASPLYNTTDYIPVVTGSRINGSHYANTAFAFRPLIRLPSSILEQNVDGVSWDIVNQGN